MPRTLDHLVLPTAGLAIARERLTALGFTVAADARHPFGTGNACVYFADGSYLEPLSLLDRDLAHQAGKDGNVFVAHDQLFRTRIGEEGFSGLAFGTGDAEADHRRYRELGVSGGAMLAFARPFRDPAGSERTAEFRLAFARDLRAPDVLFFACQRVNAPSGGRGALERHDNRVSGIRRVELSAAEPEHFDVLLGHLSESTPAGERERTVRLAKGEIVIRPVTDEAQDTTLRLKAVAFDVPDAAMVRARLDQREIVHHVDGRAIVVPPQPGQGATFIFEQA